MVEQRRVLAVYLGLMGLHRKWAGKLIFCNQLEMEVQVAAAIAGGCCLSVAWAEDARAGLRAGVSDFVVNSLDEAIRALKNEIRLGRSLSVVVTRDPTFVVSEMVERGLLPDLVVGQTSDFVDTIVVGGMAFGTGKTMQWGEVEWSLRCWRGETAAAMKKADEVASGIVAGDPIRERWIAGAARYFHRDRPLLRWLPMSDAEWEELHNRLPDETAISS